MIIYKTTNIITGKIYVGKDGRNRNSYLGSGTLLKKSIAKHGKHNFKKEILELCDTQEQLSEREIYWIEKLDSTNLNVGYNLDTGGTGGHHSEQTRQKMRDIALNRDRSFYENPVRNNKLSNARCGQKASNETRSKMREWHATNREKPTKQNKLFCGFSGRFHSNEFKKQLSEQNIGTKNPNSKIYCVVDPMDNTHTFGSRNEVVNFFNDMNQSQHVHHNRISPHNLLNKGIHKGWSVTRKLRR